MSARHEVHPIELRSYEIMESEVDFSSWPPGAAELVKRMVHATADESFARTALVGERAVDALTGALGSAATVVCDARMVAAGISQVARSCRVECYLDRASPDGSLTRSQAAVDIAAEENPLDAVWVFGNAPTALARLLELSSQGLVRPAAVIGLPVGYVGATEAKGALWASPLRDRSVTNVGRRGGSAVAAATINAAWRLAQASEDRGG
ncbi:MAG TPA: precorrin-8X methylmutase [Gaiellales bacterium]|nr:precorrin-8X methylmutase [Gaiellales bacterium]